MYFARQVTAKHRFELFGSPHLAVAKIKKKKNQVQLFQLSEHQTQYHRHLSELQSVLATKVNDRDTIQHISFLS